MGVAGLACSKAERGFLLLNDSVMTLKVKLAVKSLQMKMRNFI